MAKILVIEDDARMRQVIRRILAPTGHDIIEAADGIAGMKKFSGELPDLVITDILMPEQEGIATIRQIRATGSTVGIIAISGGGKDAGTTYLRMAGDLGADMILPKPFHAEELLMQVEDLLKSHPPAGT